MIPIEFILPDKLKEIVTNNFPNSLQAIDETLECLGTLFIPFKFSEESYDFCFHLVRLNDLGFLDKAILGNNILQFVNADIQNSSQQICFTKIGITIPMLTNLKTILENPEKQKIQNINITEEPDELSYSQDYLYLTTEESVIEPSCSQEDPQFSISSTFTEEPEKSSYYHESSTSTNDRNSLVLSKLCLDHIPTKEYEKLLKLIIQSSSSFFVKSDPLPLYIIHVFNMKSI